MIDANDQRARGNALRSIHDDGPPLPSDTSPNGTLSTVTPFWPEPIPFAAGAVVPAFPIASLPSWAQQWVNELATATQTPADLSAALTLAALATACAGRLRIQVRPGWSEPLNLYAVCVQPPGSRKSAVFAEHERPLSDWERRQSEQLAGIVAARTSELRAAEHRVAAAENRLAKANDSAERAVIAQDLRDATDERLRAEAAVPVVPRLIVSDVTSEQLAVLLHAQGGRLALWDAEGCGPFALALGRYSEGGAANFEIFLRGHSGDPLRVDRVKRPALHVSSPALTLAAMAQPALLRSLGERREARGLGLLARILWILPEPLVGRRLSEPPPVSPAAAQWYASSVTALLDLEPAHNGEPHHIRLSPEAWAELRALVEWLEPQLAPGAELEAVGDWAAKLAGAVARIAGLLHAAEPADAPWLRPVSADTMQRAIAIGQYLLGHARAAFERMAVDSDTAHAEHVLRWLCRNQVRSVTGRDLYRAMRGTFRKPADLEPVLALLAEHGFLRVAATERTGTTGRRPSPTYHAHPTVLSVASVLSPMEVESEK